MTLSNERKREWLMRLHAATHRLNRAEETHRQTQTIGPSAIVYDDMPHGSPNLSGLEAHAIRSEKEVTEILRARADHDRIHAEILAALNTLDNEVQKDVMFYRYVLYDKTPYESQRGLYGTRQLSWPEIADILSYSLDRVAHIHGEALAALQIPDVSRE